MFNRTIETNLSVWAAKDNRKPLILRGARQVGKTTVINKFGKSFDNFLAVNLEKEELRNIFESTQDVKQLLSMIFLYKNLKEKSGRTLLFIDEIQVSPKAVGLLRYFYEEMPELYVIAAGSLLENILDRHVSIPVGRVEYMSLHPCSFVEYLYAVGEERFIDYITSATLPAAFHDILINHFNIFALIGGMPEIVSRYAETKDIVSLSDIYNQLLTAYRNDIEKYAETSTQINIIRYILEEGWSYAGQTITLGGFAQSSYKAREMGEALRTLEKALLLELVYPTINSIPPATTDLKRAPKLIWLDSGLVNYAAEIQREYLLSKDLNDMWRGMAAEQIVAQELSALSNDVGKKRKFWVRAKRGSTSEVDFIYLFEGTIIPIEVKNGHNSHLKSLHQFMNETNHDIGIRIWAGKYSVDTIKTIENKTFRLINLPFYMISAIPNILKGLTHFNDPEMVV